MAVKTMPVYSNKNVANTLKKGRLQNGSFELFSCLVFAVQSNNKNMQFHSNSSGYFKVYVADFAEIVSKYSPCA